MDDLTNECRMPNDTFLHRARRRAIGIRQFVLRHELIPPRRPATPWRRLRPREPWHMASCLVLWAVFLIFAAFWVQAHWGFLIDLGLQQDDSRAFFPFHGLSEPIIRQSSIDNVQLVSPVTRQ